MLYPDINSLCLYKIEKYQKNKPQPKLPNNI